MTWTRKHLAGFPYDELLLGDVTPETPIALTLHFMGGSTALMAPFYDGYPGNLRVIFLEGETPNDAGYSWYPDLDFYDRAESEQIRQIREQVERIVPFVEAIKAAYPNAPLAMVGISQGSEVGLSLAAYYPAAFNRVIALASRMLTPQIAPGVLSGPLPEVFLLHGEQDATFPPDTTRATQQWFIDHGVRASLSLYPGVTHFDSERMMGELHQRLGEMGSK